jgi:cobalt/nickel transport system permease protein
MSLASWIEIGRMDEFARQDTPVHRIDARAKIIVTIAFMAAVMSFPPREISALTPFFLYPLGLIFPGRIPLMFILRKMLIAAPFAVVIGLFNPFFDRTPAFLIGPLVISGGWLSFISIMIRFLLTVSAALVLVACTGIFRLGAGLEQIGLPRIFAVQLLFLYRYLFVVADEGYRMVCGLELRTCGPAASGFRVYGSIVGHLLLRSMTRAERIYRAMVMRGFSGEIRIMRKTSFKPADWVFLLGCLAFFMAARFWNLAAGLGRLVTGGG